MIAARDCAREMNRTKSKFETFRYKITELWRANVWTS